MKNIFEVKISWSLDTHHSTKEYIGNRTFMCANIDGAKDYVRNLVETDDKLFDLDADYFVEIIDESIKTFKPRSKRVCADIYEAEVETKTLW